MARGAEDQQHGDVGDVGGEHVGALVTAIPRLGGANVGVRLRNSVRRGTALNR